MAGEVMPELAFINAKMVLSCTLCSVSKSERMTTLRKALVLIYSGPLEECLICAGARYNHCQGSSTEGCPG